MNEVFCMNCSDLLSAEPLTCSLCHHKIEDTDARDCEQKLIDALNNPMTDVRMCAIITIGLRHNRRAAPALVACALRNSVDLIEGLQIVDTLRVIDGGKPSIAALHYLFARHPANVVKQAALFIFDTGVAHSIETRPAFNITEERWHRDD